MHALVSNNKCIAELVQYGGLLYLLDLFCNSGAPDVREASAALFAKMLTDKLHGPKVGGPCVVAVKGMGKRLPSLLSCSSQWHGCAHADSFDSPEILATHLHGSHAGQPGSQRDHV
jgi:hypothetical protein